MLIIARYLFLLLAGIALIMATATTPPVGAGVALVAFGIFLDRAIHDKE
jgi:hypothetical protein